MFRKAFRPAALKMTALLSVACLATHAGAQDVDESQLVSASTAGAVNHTITRSMERMQMLVKSSSILTLEAKIPRF
ncbi:MAG: hypothetical protein KDB00_20825, partial [Planctomycetales bacterium]|nr:hypothetical protein [Planctomycetales bacterium]